MRCACWCFVSLTLKEMFLTFAKHDEGVMFSWDGWERKVIRKHHPKSTKCKQARVVLQVTFVLRLGAPLSSHTTSHKEVELREGRGRKVGGGANVSYPSCGVVRRHTLHKVSGTHLSARSLAPCSFSTPTRPLPQFLPVIHALSLQIS